MNQNCDFGGGVVLIKPTRAGSYKSFHEQDGLFHVLIRGSKGSKVIEKHDLVSVIQEIVNPYQDHNAFLKIAEFESLRFLISNTTEAGLSITPDEQLDDEPAASFPGKLLQLLWKRYQWCSGDIKKGLVILPCELVPENGLRLSELLSELSNQWSLPESFCIWLKEANSFCNTLVDRIVPGYPGDDESIWRELGFQDKLMVQVEPYHLWVIEGPPELRQQLPLPQAGLNVVFNESLERYSKFKIRLLNGAHTAMVPLGLLQGVSAVDEVMANRNLFQFIDSLLRQEVLPVMSMDVEELHDYIEQIYDRFKNPFFKHRLASISLNSLSKFRGRLMPTMLEFVELNERIPRRIALVLAAYLFLYSGRQAIPEFELNDDPNAIQYIGDLWKKLQRNSISRNQLVSFALSKKDLWGKDLTRVSGLSNQVIDYVRTIEEGNLDKLISSLG
jgi:tagaturonate reductase